MQLVKEKKNRYERNRNGCKRSQYNNFEKKMFYMPDQTTSRDKSVGTFYGTFHKSGNGVLKPVR